MGTAKKAALRHSIYVSIACGMITVIAGKECLHDVTNDELRLDRVGEFRWPTRKLRQLSRSLARA